MQGRQLKPSKPFRPLEAYQAPRSVPKIMLRKNGKESGKEDGNYYIEYRVIKGLYFTS